MQIGFGTNPLASDDAGVTRTVDSAGQLERRNACLWSRQAAASSRYGPGGNPPWDTSGTDGGSCDTNRQNAGKTSIRNFFSGRM